MRIIGKEEEQLLNGPCALSVSKSFEKYCEKHNVDIAKMTIWDKQMALLLGSMDVSCYVPLEIPSEGIEKIVAERDELAEFKQGVMDVINNGDRDDWDDLACELGS